MRQVCDLDQVHTLPFEYHRADGDFERDVVAAASRAIRPFAVRTAAGREFFLEAEIEEGIEIGICDEVDVPAWSSVAAVTTDAVSRQLHRE